MDSSQNIVTFANYQKEMLMSPIDYTHILTKAVDELSDSQSYRGLFHQHREGEPLPSGKSLERIVELSRAILFPGYFGNSTINSQTIKTVLSAHRTDTGRTVLRGRKFRPVRLSIALSCHGYPISS